MMRAYLFAIRSTTDPVDTYDEIVGRVLGLEQPARPALMISTPICFALDHPEGRRQNRPMPSIMWKDVQASADDVIIPVVVRSDDTRYVVVLPRIVADQQFGFCGSRMIDRMDTMIKAAITDAIDRSWKPVRLKAAVVDGSPAMRLWLRVEDFLTRV